MNDHIDTGDFDARTMEDLRRENEELRVMNVRLKGELTKVLEALVAQHAARRASRAA